jgi:mannose-6-phosphate isomerase-like protein (cupin superfamily)
MNTRTLLRLFALTITLILIPPAHSQAPAADSKPENSSALVSAKYEDAKWQLIVPALGPTGPEISILRVDPKTGATHLLIRTHAPLHVPLHFHSANETHTIVKANQAFECHGQREILTPGSFNYIPAKSHHQAWLPADSLVFITVEGPWDINWVNGPPTEKDLGDAAVAEVLSR